ncbi:MAG TPA: hypothetical protein VH796_03120 [Nitrososphaeraceae archaeon]
MSVSLTTTPTPPPLPQKDLMSMRGSHMIGSGRSSIPLPQAKKASRIKK